MQVTLKSDFTGRNIYVYDNIFSQNEKCVRQTL